MHAVTLRHQENKIEVMTVQSLIHILPGKYFTDTKYSEAIKLTDIWWKDGPNGEVFHTLNVM